MVETRTASALLSVLVGVGCIVSVVWDRGGHGEAAAVDPAETEPAARRVERERPPAPAEARAAPAPTGPKAGAAQAIDRESVTGAIGHDTALRKPNPAAYAETEADRGPPILRGEEAVNYLAGNTLKRQEPGQAAHYTFFASRGIQGDGNERTFLISAWDRNRSDVCEPGPDGVPLCRSLQIVLDGPYEYPGAKLGTVTIGGSETAVLLKGNIAKFPERIPILDDGATEPPGRPPTSGGSAIWTGLVGQTLGIEAEDAPPGTRRIVYYAPDNRILELQPAASRGSPPDAFRITIGHWHLSKATICQTASTGDAGQICFRPEAEGSDAFRLVPTGKGAKIQRISILHDVTARDLVPN